MFPSQRSLRILKLGREIPQSDEKSESDNDFSSFDSDKDLYVPSSSEEIDISSSSNDEENIPPKKRRSEINKTDSTIETCENQAGPSCSPNEIIINPITTDPVVQNTPDDELLQENNEHRNVPILDRGGLVDQREWTNPIGNHQQFDFTERWGLNPNYAAAISLDEISPAICFYAFLDNEIVDTMVNQTNLYTTQQVLANDVAGKSRLHAWQPTNQKEMLQFIGLLGYMGLVQMPSLSHYWSRMPLFRNDVASNAMSRNRFELLLRVWHFSNNAECEEGDRLHKIKPLVDLLIKKFQDIYTPGEVFCIDESIIPFQGKLVMKQYLPQKTHKYGIKLFKLCCGKGYTWNLQIYAGKERDQGASVPTNVVINLSRNLLNTGRTVITDNYYTSLDLANRLLDNRTHLIGTLRSNRRGNPKEVLHKKLKKGEIIAKENSRGVCVMKWHDKRDVLVLSTKHTDSSQIIERYTGPIRKPDAIIDYNAGKSSIDLSDQMSSYNSALRRSLKWYRKIALELLLGTTIVNAHIIFKELSQSNMTITKFREIIVCDLLNGGPYDNVEQAEGEPLPPAATRKVLKSHAFRKKDGIASSVRKYCRGCYEKKTRGEISKNTVKKVTTYCADCEGHPHFCLPCFNIKHQKI